MEALNDVDAGDELTQKFRSPSQFLSFAFFDYVLPKYISDALFGRPAAPALGLMSALYICTAEQPQRRLWRAIECGPCLSPAFPNVTYLRQFVSVVPLFLPNPLTSISQPFLPRLYLPTLHIPYTIQQIG